MKFVKGVVLSLLVAAPMVGLAESDTNVVWKKSITLGASYRSGNTDKRLYMANLKVDRASERSDWISSLYGEYGKTDGDQTEGMARLQSEYRYKFGEKRKWFGGIFAEGYNDAIKRVQYRIKIGPNIGYYWINDEKMKLDTSVGYNLVRERRAHAIKDSDPAKSEYKSDDYGEYRVAANYNWQMTETASYYFSVEYVMDAEDTDNANGLLVTGLRSKINNQLSLTVELRDEYDNKPAPETEYNDTTIIAGLTYDF
ncbi:DUF481 domain-containing protein [Pontiella sulfatireligans]|uniref:Salt-induced outer membrane protein n=1 Tax=Pontiella sulfatireligans TaxID=2750658 RepID=A0A6C2UPG1_9BACT|nr:DUF481 domain-containing protein [Pontiella sulfatireligans]VGO21823.1 hypothetical protein SCARR_03900 [Pontiella sulfatireligans]